MNEEGRLLFNISVAFSSKQFQSDVKSVIYWLYSDDFKYDRKLSFSNFKTCDDDTFKLTFNDVVDNNFYSLVELFNDDVESNIFINRSFKNLFVDKIDPPEKKKIIETDPIIDEDNNEYDIDINIDIEDPGPLE